MQPGLKLALGFMLLIAIGTLLLYLPVSHQDGADMSLIDSLFVATSAICVTGLTPVDISQTLSLFGSTVLMLLIQVGGLGYAVIAVIIIRLASGRIDASTGNLLRDSLGADHRIDTKRLLHLYREGTEVNLRYFYPQAAADPASSEYCEARQKVEQRFLDFLQDVFFPFPIAFMLCWRRTAAG